MCVFNVYIDSDYENRESSMCIHLRGSLPNTYHPLGSAEQYNTPYLKQIRSTFWLTYKQKAVKRDCVILT